jgi:hypothetical protein
VIQFVTGLILNPTRRREVRRGFRHLEVFRVLCHDGNDPIGVTITLVIAFEIETVSTHPLARRETEFGVALPMRSFSLILSAAMLGSAQGTFGRRRGNSNLPVPRSSSRSETAAFFIAQLPRGGQKDNGDRGYQDDPYDQRQDKYDYYGEQQQQADGYNEKDDRYYDDRYDDRGPSPSVSFGIYCSVDDSIVIVEIFIILAHCLWFHSSAIEFLFIASATIQ